jgi:ribosomal protein L12E/L44/L45/RPP1/RPP2
MANLIKTDDIESALIGAGVDPSSDEAIAIREAVRGGDSLDTAIKAFAPTPSAALATQAAAPVVAAKKKRKGDRGDMAAVDLTVKAVNPGGDIDGAHRAGVAIGIEAIDPLLESYEAGVTVGVTQAVEASQRRVANFLGDAIGSLGTSFAAIAGEDD